MWRKQENSTKYAAVRSALGLAVVTTSAMIDDDDDDDDDEEITQFTQRISKNKSNYIFLSQTPCGLIC